MKATRAASPYYIAKALSRCLRALSLISLLMPLNAKAAPPDLHPAAGETAEQELRRLSQDLLDAVAPGDREVWDRTLHSRFLQVDENGGVHGKGEVLDGIQPLPPGLVGHIEIDAFRVERVGNTAVVALELQEHLDYHGQVLHSRFRSLETWVEEDGAWKLLAQHVAAVLKDPSEMRLSKDELCAYAGRYALTDEIVTTISCDASGLSSERPGRPPTHFKAETRDVFFEPGRPRTRRIFLRDAQGQIEAFVDRREGEDLRWRALPSPEPEPSAPR
ncbi:MAG: nuclear transport factor 2 family protein [Acidobacteria bacterium]|nr:nuclear transport factor 2 family protein [Acidobacteriota bacterium]